jgi:hypothetical protein
MAGKKKEFKTVRTFRLDALPKSKDANDPNALWEQLEIFDSRNDARKFAALHNQNGKGKLHYSITEVIDRIPISKPTSTRELV